MLNVTSGNEKFPHYWSSPQRVADSMQQALDAAAAAEAAVAAAEAAYADGEGEEEAEAEAEL